eukprot:12417499-Karenia_brevis.AAC.1
MDTTHRCLDDQRHMHTCTPHVGKMSVAPVAPVCVGRCWEADARTHTHMCNTRGDGVGEDSMAPAAPVGVRI